MEEALITTIHSSIATWLTPTILFIFLNLVIATILFTSNLPSNHKPPTQNDTVPSKLPRSPSNILHRLKSFQLHPHKTSLDHPSPTTINHHEQQQESLHIAAATQYVFNNPFPHPQDPQPVLPNPEKFHFDPTRFDSDPNRFVQINEVPLTDAQPPFVLQKPQPHPDVFDPTRFDSDPARFDQTNRVKLSDVQTHTLFEKPLSGNSKKLDFDPTRLDFDSTRCGQTNEVKLSDAQKNFVFKRPLSEDSKNIDFDSTRLNSDPTQFDEVKLSDAQKNSVFKKPLSEKSKKLNFDPARFDQTNEVKLNNVETHFVVENYTVEKVTTLFDYGSGCIKTENPPEQETGIVETHEEELENDDLESLDDVYSMISGRHVNRTKSDTKPTAGEVPVKLSTKMKKSASVKSAFAHFEEDKIVEARRPETVRERRSTARAIEDDDVKANDFINKLPAKMKKSASVKSAFAHLEEDKIVEARRPETVRDRRSTAKAIEDDDIEVDAKADDFINKLPAKMKKSASVKSEFAHFEENKIVEARRPETVRERRSTSRAIEDDDLEVDAKADDFINKFKHQLKLQRLDSITRYKDMVNRRGAK